MHIFITDLVVKRKLCEVWLLKLECVNRELKVYVVNCGLDHISSFKTLVLCYFAIFFALFVIFLFIFQISFTAESLVFLLTFLFTKIRKLYSK